MSVIDGQAGCNESAPPPERAHLGQFCRSFTHAKKLGEQLTTNLQAVPGNNPPLKCLI